MNDSSQNSGKAAVLAFFLLAVVGAFGFIFWRRGQVSDSGAAGSSSATPNAAPAAPNANPPTAQTTIRFLYSTEKKAWLNEALQRFRREHPEIRVDTVEKGSFDLIQSLLDQGEKPTLISPADDVQLNLLASDYKQKTGTALTATDGEDKPVPLVLTPLVFVAWEDRAAVLTGNERTLSFTHLETAVSSPRGWIGVKGKAEWGFIKLGHTNPTRSNSGLQTLVLLAYEYHKKRSGLEVKDVMDEGFQKFVKSLEKGVPKFGSSTGEFMDEMVLYGPSKYDVVVSYENLAIQNIANAQGRWGSLRIYYPQQTMWSSNPVAILNGDWISKEQREAAHVLVRFLLDKPEQERALALGFRPSNPSVPILTADANNPFKKAEPFGVRADIGSVVEAPEGPVIRNLMEMWARMVGR